MKKIILFILIQLICIGNVYSSDPIELIADRVKYLCEDGYATVIGAASDDETIIIKDTINFENENYIVTTISGCFLGNKNIFLPNTIKNIEKYAFGYSLEKINIPASVEIMQSDAFADCRSLSRIDIDSLESWCNINFVSEGSNPFWANSYYFMTPSLYLYINGEKVINLVIPEGVTDIRNYAFIGYSLLESIELPDSLLYIGHRAFGYCNKLIEISIPENVEFIDSWAFQGCENLTTVNLGKRIKEIGGYSFPTVINVNSYAAFPPRIYEDTFSKDIEYDGELHIPQGCLPYYNDSINWTKFNKVIDDLPVAIGKIELNMDSLAITNGESFYLTAQIFPNIEGYNMINWSSSNEEIASVDENGIIKAKNIGEVIIKATSGYDNSIFAECFITILNREINPEIINLNIESSNLNIGETLQLVATILPENTTDPTVIWNSNNEEIASVSENGLVTAISAGEAIIIATCGEVSAECVITVFEDAGVESLLANPNSKISIYSVDGILIKKDCKAEDLKSLPKGIYIVVSGKDRYKISI